MRASSAPEPARAGHWLLRDAEPVRRRIDGDAIVVVAHRLVHDGGGPALTMRSLAASLGTSTSALYRVVPSKPWLLVAIVDLVFAEVALPPAGGRADARARLEALSMSVRDVLESHPHLHEILASHVAVTPNTVRIADAALTCLRDAGLAADELIDAYNAWIGYVIGFTTIEAKPAEYAPELELQRAMRAELERSTAAGSPVLEGLVADAANLAYGLSWLPVRLGGSEASFEWGLEALLDGFERRARRRRP
jgi:AcrR family transcriptional regulator